MVGVRGSLLAREAVHGVERARHGRLRARFPLTWSPRSIAAARGWTRMGEAARVARRRRQLRYAGARERDGVDGPRESRRRDRADAGPAGIVGVLELCASAPVGRARPARHRRVSTRARSLSVPNFGLSGRAARHRSAASLAAQTVVAGSRGPCSTKNLNGRPRRAAEDGSPYARTIPHRTRPR